MSHARKQSRKAIVQALYQWQMTAANIGDIEQQFREENANAKMDFEYFVELLHNIPSQVSELDALIKPLVARSMSEINPVELAILRLGTYELKNRLDIPYRVTINEGVDLAKKFGADQGHKFINGMLDKLAKQLRVDEIKVAKKDPKRSFRGKNSRDKNDIGKSASGKSFSVKITNKKSRAIKNKNNNI